MSTHRISQLIYRHILGTITPDEQAELDRWIAAHPDNAAFFQSMADSPALDRDLKAARRIDPARPAADMQLRIDRTRRLSLRRRMMKAAALLAVPLLGAALWMLMPDTSLNTGMEEPATIASRPLTIEDITPGSVGAVYTTPNGEAITLNASDTSIIANKLIANADRCQANRTADNLSLEVGRGHEFKIILEDSTVVWLNSESMLSYPEVFSSDERRVHVTGEAYFEVKPDAKRPFYVETDEQVVRVYGTAFNIRAYGDDPYVYTTLEHGSIAITRADISSGEVLLSPGHQALLNREDSKLNMRIVDTQVITGWRNGRFVFEDQPLSVIMRDLARWYDFEYEFEEPELEEIIFMGSIPRYSDFTVAKRILERSGDIELRTSDNKIIISHCK